MLDGGTLRNILAKLLNCDPMRITKKFTGNSSIGKRTFLGLARTDKTEALISEQQQILSVLRDKWIAKLFMAQEFSSRKNVLAKGMLRLPCCLLSSYHINVLSFFLSFVDLLSQTPS
jgi:hypothetical protein